MFNPLVILFAVAICRTSSNSCAGYDVTYHEFDGPHTVSPAIAREGLAWWLEFKK